MHRQPESHWIEAPTSDVLPLLDDPELIEKAKSRLSSNVKGRKPRESSHEYVLRDLLFCDLCGHRMQGSARPNRSHDRIRLLYRCEIGTRLTITDDVDHPKTFYINEDTITSWLHQWLREIAAGRADPAQIRHGN